MDYKKVKRKNKKQTSATDITQQRRDEKVQKELAVIIATCRKEYKDKIESQLRTNNTRAACGLKNYH